METQSDMRIRVVALANLRAMCERASGTCHRYKVEEVSRSRVHVTYSNPDEYGREHPVTAVYPCYPSDYWPHDTENPRVVLDVLRVIGDDSDGEGYQYFEPLTDCPSLWRDTPNDEPRWRTHGEIMRDDPSLKPGGHDPCVVCDLPEGKE